MNDQLYELYSKIDQLRSELDAERGKVIVVLELIHEYGGIDGEHHKKWVLDQILRNVAGIEYVKWVADYKAGEDGPETYEWDEGIAP